MAEQNLYLRGTCQLKSKYECVMLNIWQKNLNKIIKLIEEKWFFTLKLY